MEEYKPVQLDTFPSEKRIFGAGDNLLQLSKIDNEAREAGELIGRFIQEPYADGYAYYQIVEEDKQKNNVLIMSCKQLGDDWVIPYWGDKTWIDKDYAEGSIKFRDQMAASYAKRVGKRVEPERPGDPKI